MQGWRQLPDGTWLDEATGTVSAPIVEPQGGGEFKRDPSPDVGPLGPPLQASAMNPQAPTTHGMGELSVAKKIFLIGAVVGVATLTVWLQRKGAGSTKAKK